MPRLIYKNKETFFVHIPKTSGTSLYANLMHQGVIVNDYNPYVSVFENVSSHHLDAKQVLQYYNNVKNKFTIIRNPWHRTLSDYVYQTKDNSFTKLNNWVYVNLYKYKKNPNILDNHIKPMIHFIDKNTKVFVLDDIDKMYTWLNSIFENKFTYTIKKNVSKPYQNITKTTLSKEALDLWKETYDRDIQLFNQLTK
jgi:UDP-N-acetylmuramyl tripeptide synthase